MHSTTFDTIVTAANSESGSLVDPNGARKLAEMVHHEFYVQQENNARNHGLVLMTIEAPSTGMQQHASDLARPLSSHPGVAALGVSLCTEVFAEGELKILDRLGDSQYPSSGIGGVTGAYMQDERKFERGKELLAKNEEIKQARKVICSLWDVAWLLQQKNAITRGQNNCVRG